MSSQDRTSITNLALRELGAFRIDDFAEDTREAEIARDLWEQAVLKALSRHEWQFATTGASLARSGVTPPTRYRYTYTLPGDFVRLSSVSATQDMQSILQGSSYRIRSQGLESSESALFIEYVYNQPALGTWPAWFIDVFVADFAALMAAGLKSTTERERLEQLATERLRDGKSIDSTQQPVIKIAHGSWASAVCGRGGDPLNRGNGGLNVRTWQEEHGDVCCEITRGVSPPTSPNPGAEWWDTNKCAWFKWTEVQSGVFAWVDLR